MAQKQKKVAVSDSERQLLTEHIKTSPLILLRFKAQSILLAEAGGTPELIAAAVDRKSSTIARWLHDWRKRRLASIFTGHQDNDNAGKLTRGQLEEIRQALQSPPSDFGLPKALWDVPQLKTYVSAAFGVQYESDRSYRYVLQFCNLSFKYPDTFDRKRDEALIAKRMEAIRAEIQPLLHRTDWEVFACDEVKMQQDAIIRRAWLKKGERTIVKVDRDKQSQSYIGFLNQRTFRCHLYEMDWQNSEEVLKAFEQFLSAYPDKRICIVWDNAPFHKSKQIREQLQKHGILERVHLIAMPPYAPDENPIEHIWNTAKQAVANIQRNTFQQTKQAFSDFVASRSFRYSF